MADAFAERLNQSTWVTSRRGLAEAASLWEADFSPDRATLDAHAARLARPGPASPLRAARHLGALQAGQVRWALQKLPLDLMGGLRPIREPGPWLKESIAYIVRDQLSMLGPAGAELARIIDESQGLAPGVAIEELRRRPVKAAPIHVRTVERVAHQAFGVSVRRVVAGPVSLTPLSQMHRAILDDGGRAFLRVRRPGIRSAIRADARIASTIVAPFEWLLPAMREAHPLGFVELATRQLLEEIDLRHDALNTVPHALLPAIATGRDQSRAEPDRGTPPSRRPDPRTASR